MYKVTIEVDSEQYARQGEPMAVETMAEAAINVAKMNAHQVGARFVTVRVHTVGIGAAVADQIEANLHFRDFFREITVERYGQQGQPQPAPVYPTFNMPRVGPEPLRQGRCVPVPHISAEAPSLLGKLAEVLERCERCQGRKYVPDTAPDPADMGGNIPCPLCNREQMSEHQRRQYPAPLTHATAQWLAGAGLFVAEHTDSAGLYCVAGSGDKFERLRESVEPGPGPQAATYRVPGKERVISPEERQGGYNVWVDNFTADRLDIVRHAIPSRDTLPGHLFYPIEVVRAALNSTRPQPLPMPPELQAQMPHVVKVIDRDAGVVFHGNGKIEHTGQPQAERLEGWCPTCGGVESLGHRLIPLTATSRTCPEADKPGGGWVDRRPAEPGTVWRNQPQPEQAAPPFLAGKTDQEVLQGAQQWLNVLRAQLPDTEATRWARTIEQVLLHHQALLNDTRKGADPPRFTHQALPVYTADQVAAAIDTAMSRPTELWREAGMVRPDLLEVIKADVLAALPGAQRETRTVSLPVPEGGRAVAKTLTITGSDRQRLVHYYQNCGQWVDGDTLASVRGPVHPDNLCEACKALGLAMDTQGRTPKC